MDQALISRETLAKRWEISIPTVINYENEGLITRVPGIPSPRYNIEEIMEVEGSDMNPLSPMERKRLERELSEITIKYDKVKCELNRLVPGLVLISNM